MSRTFRKKEREQFKKLAKGFKPAGNKRGRRVIDSLVKQVFNNKDGWSRYGALDSSGGQASLSHINKLQ
jgi:hypothetical protein